MLHTLLPIAHSFFLSHSAEFTPCCQPQFAKKETAPFPCCAAGSQSRPFGMSRRLSAIPSFLPLPTSPICRRKATDGLCPQRIGARPPAFCDELKTACWEERLGVAASRRRRQPPSFYYFYECSKLGGSRILFFARGALPLPFPFCVFCCRHGQSIRKAFTLCRQRLAHCSRFPTTADCDVINSRQAATGRVFSSFVLPLPHFPFLLFGEQSQPIFGCQNPHNTNNNTQTTCCWGMIRGHG